MTKEQNLLRGYFRDIFKTAKPKDATEASYYPALKKLLEDYLIKKGRIPNITVVPKKTIAGIPDFTVRREHELIGYIEAKDPKYENLRALPARDREQLRRYQEKLPNLILTNFFDFWLWRKDEKRWVKQVSIGAPRVLQLPKMAPPPQNEGKFFDLLSVFFNFYIPERKSAKSLAEELAGRAQLLRPYIIELLGDEKDGEIGRVYKSFTEFLILTFLKMILRIFTLKLLPMVCLPLDSDQKAEKNLIALRLKGFYPKTCPFFTIPST